MTPNTFQYYCNFNECNKYYQNFYKFKQHVIKHDKCMVYSQKTTYEGNRNKNLPTTSLSTCTKSTEQPIFQLNIPDINNLKASILKNTISMSLRLHSRSNIARNNVPEVQKDITCVITPLINTLELYIPFLPEDAQSSFSELINIARNPFQDIDSEYKFFKQLEQLDLFKFPKQFLISKDLDEIFVRGQPTLEANNTECCFCDIKHQLQKYF